MEVLKQVSSKLPSYSGVKWCRHAFDMKKNCGQVVTFHDLVKIVETEADLATDPVFSPDVLKSECNRRFEKDKNPRDRNRRPPPNLNSLLTATGDPPKSSSPPADSKTSLPSIICPVCSKLHTISNCDEFKKKAVKEHLDFIQSVGLCFGCLSKGHYSKNSRKRLTCQKYYFQNESECFIGVSKHRETNESTRPQAEYFYCFEVFGYPDETRSTSFGNNFSRSLSNKS